MKHEGAVKLTKKESFRLARSYSFVAGLSYLYVAYTAVFEREELFEGVVGADIAVAEEVAWSWAARTVAIAVGLLVAAAFRNPSMLFLAILIRLMVDIADLIVIIQSSAESLVAVPIVLLIGLELFLLTQLRKYV